MRSRRILAAVIATAALAGLGLTGATAATAQSGAISPAQCRQGGGTPDFQDFTCKGGTYNGRYLID
ncbi:hypothetical protein [Streptomyces sp. TP-A0356]|uniref:hypothetical protein n=1 Tax=Streptomyces sp. TP-A0356 TaxID=1359208 RepID=UPI00099F340C|nr:hypothetical protein [Streptomyces sp. TP-A0356]